MPTVFAFVRALGAPVAAAYALHALVAALAAFAVWRVWQRCGDWQLRSAALMTGTFLMSPYAMVYDLAWLALPIAWLALAGVRHGWLRGEREALIAAWLLPLFLSPVAMYLHLRLGPWVLGALLWAVFRRAGLRSKVEQDSAPAAMRFVIAREPAAV
jgi:hypothetical protein